VSRHEPFALLDQRAEQPALGPGEVAGGNDGKSCFHVGRRGGRGELSPQLGDQGAGIEGASGGPHDGAWIVRVHHGDQRVVDGEGLALHRRLEQGSQPSRLRHDVGRHEDYATAGHDG